ncbi:hypothetical protein PFICI_12522 [Pestalotiopsis fici W106-1]|uniref:Cytochrome P450 n=1 Tax=Pestalotiopsis fici (strain W106-1 / CGMCC3.15140) TaxID=1229662 RepID=W3WNZ2_PESFW|nr:uncharacterized protein PFICI_12522 [Pestalotiopsis fici W106-1]ETS75578.1 hypothetical protein PFICI_12522 [Pestalotiopsis fici W106-1]
MQKQGVPTLPHSWLFGHLALMAKFRQEHPPDVNIFQLHYWFLNELDRLFPGEKIVPPIIYLDLWPFTSSSLLLSTHPAVSTQFTQTRNLIKAKVHTDFLKPLTENKDIISLHGEEWKSWRSKLQPGFNRHNLMVLLPDLMDEVVIFVDLLGSLAGKDGQWGEVFRLEEKTMNLTFDVIHRALTGSQLNQQTSCSDTPLKSALLDQLDQMGRSGANPARGFFHLLTLLPTAIVRNNRVMNSVYGHKIQEWLSDGSRSRNIPSIIDRTLEIIDLEGPLNGDGTNLAAFVDGFTSNLKALLFAGHDTTSTTICWMFKELQDNPVCLERLREEHDTVFGTEIGACQELILNSPHLLYALPYTLAIIKETLRLYPLAATMRQGSSDYLLTVPGSRIRYPTDGYAMWDAVPIIHSRPDVWRQADKFLPERWLVPEGDPLRPSKDAWRPFSLGPRICIGLELALLELRLVLVFVVRKFDIEEAWTKWDTKK